MQGVIQASAIRPGSRLERRFYVGESLWTDPYGVFYRSADEQLANQEGILFAPDPELVHQIDDFHVAAQRTASSVVPVMGHGEEGGTPWVVYRQIPEARPLNALILGPDDAFDVTLAILEALEAAERELGRPHLRLEPSQVLVVEEGEDLRAYLLGYGLKTLRTPNAPSLAPEVRNGSPGDTRSDLYALGAFMPTRVSDYGADDHDPSHGPPTELGDLGRQLDRYWERLANPSPDLRPQTIREAIDALQSLRRPATPAAPWPLADEPGPRRLPWIAISAGVLGCIAAVALVVALWPRPAPPPVARAEGATTTPPPEPEAPVPPIVPSLGEALVRWREAVAAVPPAEREDIYIWETAKGFRASNLTHKPEADVLFRHRPEVRVQLAQTEVPLAPLGAGAPVMLPRGTVVVVLPGEVPDGGVAGNGNRLPSGGDAGRLLAAASVDRVGWVDGDDLGTLTPLDGCLPSMATYLNVDPVTGEETPAGKAQRKGNPELIPGPQLLGRVVLQRSPESPTEFLGVMHDPAGSKTLSDVFTAAEAVNGVCLVSSTAMRRSFQASLGRTHLTFGRYEAQYELYETLPATDEPQDLTTWILIRSNQPSPAWKQKLAVSTLVFDSAAEGVSGSPREDVPVRFRQASASPRDKPPLMCVWSNEAVRCDGEPLAEGTGVVEDPAPSGAGSGSAGGGSTGSNEPAKPGLVW